VFWQKDVELNGAHQGTDFITDFGSGDKIDLTDFFKTADWVDADSVMKLTVSGGNTTLSVDTGAGFVDVVTLGGSHQASPQSYVDDMVILV